MFKKKIHFILFLAIIFGVFFYLTDYVYNEGFNPTDEGVILAQSFRIINGEIPHKDFISIRPAGSGYFHALNYLIPAPVFVTARYFVLIQFFIIAVLCSLFFYNQIDKNSNLSKNATIYFFALIISSYTISILNYNLFSWTTIDAVFWSVISLYLLSFASKKIHYIFALISISMAALSRQTFALATLMAFVYTFYVFRKNIISSVVILLSGALPFILYFSLLIYHNALIDFMLQMSGRTEFFETAILQFVKRFFLSWSTALNVLTIVISIFIYFKKDFIFKRFFVKNTLTKYLPILYIAITFLLVIKYFLSREQNIYTLPFELFFSAIAISIFNRVCFSEQTKLFYISLTIILISWISAISLGDNTPVFSSGPLFITVVINSVNIIILSKSNIPKFFPVLTLFLSLIVLFSGFVSQRKFNYRDNPAQILDDGLYTVSAQFGKIKTNKNLIEYYSELKTIIESLPSAKNNTIVYPHNAAFYPAFNTRNPFTLDWLITNEFVGQEQRVKSDLEKLLYRDKIYIIIDNCNLITISNSYNPSEYSNIIKEFAENHLMLIQETKYFKIYYHSFNK
jgi:hypothetical protein